MLQDIEACTDDIVKFIFLKLKICVLIQISL